MLERLKSIATGAADLFRVEAEIALTRARRTGAWSVVVVAAAGITGLSLAGLVVAAAATLALAVGWIASLAIVSVVLLAAAVAVLVVASDRVRTALDRESLPDAMIERSARARREIAVGNDLARESGAGDHERPSPDRDRPNQADPFQPREAVAEFIAKNPGVALGGIAAVAAVLGPSRTIKFASRGMLLAGLAAKVGKHAATSRSGRVQPDRMQDRSTHDSRAAAGAGASVRASAD